MTPRTEMENPAAPSAAPATRGAAPAPEEGVSPSRAIAAASALATAGAALLLIEAFGAGAREIGSGYMTWLLLAAAVEAASAIGFRMRKRWALAAYLSFFPLHQLIIAAAAGWSPFGFALRLTVVVLAFSRVRRLH